VWNHEFTSVAAGPAPLAQELPIRGELHDPTVFVSIRDVETAIRTYGDVGRSIEVRPVPAADTRLTARHEAGAVMREAKRLVQRRVGEPDVVVAIDGETVRQQKLPGAPGGEYTSVAASSCQIVGSGIGVALAYSSRA
jgi:hypothetical protein